MSNRRNLLNCYSSCCVHVISFPPRMTGLRPEEASEVVGRISYVEHKRAQGLMCACFSTENTKFRWAVGNFQSSARWFTSRSASYEKNRRAARVSRAKRNIGALMQGLVETFFHRVRERVRRAPENSHRTSHNGLTGREVERIRGDRSP